MQEPKLREIFAPSFPDRIVQAWLATRMEPILERCQIDDTYANRKGKGTLTAIRKAQGLMRQPGHAWVMHLDVRNFFHAVHRFTLLQNWLDLLGKESLPLEQRSLMAYVSTAILQHNSTAGHLTVGSSKELLAFFPRRQGRGTRRYPCWMRPTSVSILSETLVNCSAKERSAAPWPESFRLWQQQQMDV